MIGILRGPLPRIVLFGMMLLALQTTFFTEMRPFDVSIQIVLAFVAAAGVAGGPEGGAVTGFVLGLLYDLAAGSPIGSTSITFGLAGVIAGIVTRFNITVTWWLAMLFVALGAAAGELAVPVVRIFLGETDVVSDRLFVIVPVVAVAGALVSPLFLPVSRWCLRLGTPEWKVPAE
jgi:rod shape-determining protein MreD